MLKIRAVLAQRWPVWMDRWWRGVAWWGKYQWLWWVMLTVLVLSGISYDVGRLVTRAELVTLGGPAAGTMSMAQMMAKASESGGHLTVTSQNSARFVDHSGSSWEVPQFGDSVTRADMRILHDHRVPVDGNVDIAIKAVKTSPRDLILTAALDAGFQIGLLAVYGTLAWLLLRQLRTPSQRFRRVDSRGRPATRIHSVAGYEGPKQEVLEIVDYLRRGADFARVGARPPHGVLLYGPPGTGKTLLAKAIAGEAAACFLEQSASSFIQIYAGEGARAVRALFAEARRRRPCVVFIDEIDAIGGARAGASLDERVQALNALLTEMDGFGDNTGVVVVAATNRIEVLDEALVRRGRFDRQVHIPLPSRADRAAILAVHAARLPSLSADLGRWAAQTVGFSGADLENLVNEAAVEAARSGASTVTDREFAGARERVLLGARSSGQGIDVGDRRTIAVHELGHAAVRLAFGKGVEKVSVLPRGRALGVTLPAPEEKEQIMQTPHDLLLALAVLMGGRAAESVCIGTVSSGSADDIARASAMARDAVRRYGWAGTAYVPDHPDMVVEVERHAARWVADAENVAVAIVGSVRERLLEASTRLAQMEEMDAAGLLVALGDIPPPPPFKHASAPPPSSAGVAEDA